MNALLLAFFYHFLKEIIIFKGKGNGYFFKVIFLQNRSKRGNGTDYSHAFVFKACLVMIVEETVYRIAPLGVAYNTVDERLSRLGVAHQKNVLLIVASLTCKAEGLS